MKLAVHYCYSYFIHSATLSLSLSLLSYKCLNEPKMMTTNMLRRVSEKSTADVCLPSPLADAICCTDSSVFGNNQAKKTGLKLHQCQRVWVQLEC